MPSGIIQVPLAEAASTRYLSYALSVITARALPDVRDGLKPVQRRILYAMLHDLHLNPDARFKKSAKVVGEVMGSYHPHGDQAIYDALVRLAQPFSLRYPLVEGSGNFGSIDGDRAAAMRYTEVRLRHLAIELLDELKFDTVDERPNYDGTRQEPEVLPAQVPNLLINGSTGIAVGMATNIPPHNIGDVVTALVALVDDRDTPLTRLVELIQGPDFPTGGEILNSRDEILEIYRTGSGPIKLRGTHRVERDGRICHVVIDSIPYGLEKDALVEKIGDLIGRRQVPQFVDIRDESTEEIRIVIELKGGEDPEAGMAYLYRHSPLRQAFHVNMTCLVPAGEGQLVPRRLDLKEMLLHFLDFRFVVLERRHRHELRKLEERLHLLEGFETIFDHLDEAIAIIRKSDGRQPAARALQKRFGLTEVQSLAVVDLRLYKLSRLEIAEIRRELTEVRARRDEVMTILASESLRWQMVRTELLEVADPYDDERRTRIVGPVEENEFRQEEYIVDEDGWVIVTDQGWIKKQKGFTDVGAIRVREGDQVRWLHRGRNRRTMAFFTNFGSVYTLRIADIVTTSGFGDPLQSQFTLQDRERVVGICCYDPRCLPVHAGEAPAGAPPEAGSGEESPGEVEVPQPPYGVVMTRSGRVLRFSLAAFVEPSTRKGRQYCRLRSSFPGDEVISVVLSAGEEHVCLATGSTRVLMFHVGEIPVLSGPGQGVMGIKTDPRDPVVAGALLSGRREALEVVTNRGAVHALRPGKPRPAARGGKGKPILSRDRFVSMVPEEVRPVPEPSPAEPQGEDGNGPVSSGTGRTEGDH